MNIELRENLLAPYYKTKGKAILDINYFEGVPLSILEQLVTEGLVDMDSWNGCPGVEAAFLPFMRRNPLFTAHGYSIDPRRDDSRITIEGVELDEDYTKGQLADFVHTFRGADDLDISTADPDEHDYLRCWYD